jgi:hypothetical protein
MTTLAIMKARIADELARDDLTSQIAYAITDAITAYEDERFHFNETRAITFPTELGQEFYDENDAAAIATIQKVDYVKVYIGDQAFDVRYEDPGEMESLSVSGTMRGIPWSYTWYGNQVRLYPTPDQAYTIRIGASVKVAPPVADDTAGNAWMTHAERLIRSRAKLELALHVLKDDALAATMAQGVTEAWDQLKARTNQLTGAPKGRVKAMGF